jgi:hypothetical protein
VYAGLIKSKNKKAKNKRGCVTKRRKNVTTITLDDQLIEEVISVSYCQNAQEAII